MMTVEQLAQAIAQASSPEEAQAISARWVEEMNAKRAPEIERERQLADVKPASHPERRRG